MFKLYVSGRNPGQMVFLGVGYGSIPYFRFRGQMDLYSWDTKLDLTVDNMVMVWKSRDCLIITYVDVGSESILWVLVSNIQDFVGDQTGSYGPSILLTAVEDVPIPA